MTIKEIILPLYINGGEIHGSELAIEYDKSHGPVNILLPSITPDQIAKIGAGARDLAELTLGDILEFLAKVQAIWADDNHPLRREAFEIARLVTGFHDKELEIDFSYIPALLSEQVFLRPTLESELREPSILDEWRTVGGSRVKAFPRGRVLHILAGNVPGSELLSLMRGVITKNANILKMASGNPVSPVYLMKSFLEVDPEHPVTKSTSIVYWPHQSPAEEAAFALADAVCVWGGFDAVHLAWKNSRPLVPVLDYGPKRSMLFIDRESLTTDDACARVAAAAAEDIVIHDQLACHSPQVAFVERPAHRFCEALGQALTVACEKLPKGHVSIDQNAHISHTRMMSELRGDKVYHPHTNEWSIIMTGDFARTMETPLSRTLYVLEVDDLEEAVRFADKYTMVIGFSSSRRLEDLKNKLSLRGVDRLTKAGNMGLIPPGFPHEGRYDLTRLVRWVGADDLDPW